MPHTSIASTFEMVSQCALRFAASEKSIPMISGADTIDHAKKCVRPSITLSGAHAVLPAAPQSVLPWVLVTPTSSMSGSVWKGLGSGYGSAAVHQREQE